MNEAAMQAGGTANAGKFHDPEVTADGAARARVALTHPRTLWFNTGTLCNIACTNCYIGSGPASDRLEFISAREVARYLAELATLGWPVEEIGFTGGEPFLNPGIIRMMEASLEAGFRVLTLTNAMRPMMRPRLQQGLKRLIALYGDRLTLRVSLDHWERALHDQIRGQGSYDETVAGLVWLGREGARLAVAGRALWDVDEDAARAGYAGLFAALGLDIDAHDPGRTVILPEIDATVAVPEISEASWAALGASPADVMCASGRTVVKRRGYPASVLACPLIVDDPAFELGPTLAEADRPVRLTHSHCAQFCLLGGASGSV